MTTILLLLNALAIDPLGPGAKVVLIKIDERRSYLPGAESADQPNREINARHLGQQPDVGTLSEAFDEVRNGCAALVKRLAQAVERA